MPPSHEQKNPLRDMAVTFAGVAIILAFAQHASAVIVPFLLAMFISIVALTPVNWLRKRGFSSGVAITFVLMTMIFLLLAVAVLLGSSLRDFNQALPAYQEQINSLVDNISSFLMSRGIDIRNAGIIEALDPGTIMKLVNKLISSIAGTMSNSVLIFFTISFMLIDFVHFPEKIRQTEESGNSGIYKELQYLIKNTNQYVALKTIISLGTGFLIWVGLALIGLDFVVLWAFLAFVLNFIPNIGSLLAAIPAVLLALIQLGPSWALAVACLYVVVNTVMGSIVEPKVMGDNLGLSALTVFLSLVFCGWLFGPIGMILSVPIAMVIQHTAMINPQTRWLGILLGSAPVKHNMKSSTRQEIS